MLVKAKRFLGKVRRGPIQRFKWFLIDKIPYLNVVAKTRTNESPVAFSHFFRQVVLGKCHGAYWPVDPTSRVIGARNVLVGIDAAPGISPGCYIQAIGKIYIGDYSQIAPNVGIISSNHFMLDIRRHVINEVRIGAYCRIGMGSIILPGTVLGDFTTVGAGSVVKGKFPNGYCVIAGNPAEVVADYSQDADIVEKFVRYENENRYHGFIPADKFSQYRNKNLYV